MKFELSTAGYFYSKEEAEPLKELGFKFDTASWENSIRCSGIVITDHTPDIEFDTLEQLISFIAKQGNCVVSCDSITIYDDYLE